ncbi:MAG: formamidopyrimidine-DNA glycosylase [Planctomycetes bacterium]|nr:formamidopyrimidine-DNA glycosylase [Planctomycetota bacterium]
MPELPDIEAYMAALRPRIVGQRIQHIRILSPFVLRTVEPPIDALLSNEVTGLRRIGKRIVIETAGRYFAVIHLMIAGRFRWSKAGAKPPGRIGLAAFDFLSGTLQLTEAGTKRRASLHLVGDEAELDRFDRGGIEPLTAGFDQFAAKLRCENHTLKRSLTDPRLFSGIGNAYSDEILHAAGLSPVRLTAKLKDDEITRLRSATIETLSRWVGLLTREFVDRFPGPGDVTAFRKEFAAHGKFKQPCSRCGVDIQRIRYADNETNYCPKCQTDGKILADRSLSRLLRDEWPRTVEELEER